MTTPSPVSELKLATRALYRTDWVDGTVEHRVLDYLNQHFPAEYIPFHIEKFERDGKTVIWSRLRSGSIAQEGWSTVGPELLETLKDARQYVEKWCHYQGTTNVLFDTYLQPIDDTIAKAEALARPAPKGEDGR